MLRYQSTRFSIITCYWLSINVPQCLRRSRSKEWLVFNIRIINHNWTCQWLSSIRGWIFAATVISWINTWWILVRYELIGRTSFVMSWKYLYLLSSSAVYMILWLVNVKQDSLTKIQFMVHFKMHFSPDVAIFWTDIYCHVSYCVVYSCWLNKNKIRHLLCSHPKVMHWLLAGFCSEKIPTSTKLLGLMLAGPMNAGGTLLT